MLICKEISGAFVQYSFGEHAEECHHLISWSVYIRRDTPRTMAERRFDKRPRFKLCAHCAAKKWRARESATAA
jgi:hypothetical protein